MKKLRTILFAVIFAGSLVGSMAAPAFAAPPAAPDPCHPRLLTFPTWYNHLEKADGSTGCTVKSPNEVGGIGNFIWIIALNIVEILLQLVAYVSIGYLIYGGFKYLTSGGQSSRITAGRETILNAIIGLVISFFSVALVSFIAGSIK